GPNGAGKTTTLRMVMGLIAPDSGQVHVLGRRVGPGTPVLARVGALIEGPGFLPHLSGRANLEAYWAATGRDPAEAGYEEVLEIAALGGAVERPVRTYSHGMRQRLGIAQAMLGLPEVLVLDEPTNGLDPAGRREMLELVRQLSRELGKSVVFSTHILQDVEAVCDSAVVMERGRVAAQGDLHELTAGAEREYRLRVDPSSVDVLPVLAEHWRAEARGDGCFAVWLPEDADTNPVFGIVRDAGANVRSFTLQRRTLEEVFLTAVRDEEARP
ncbi:MAG: ABC transporter ATP-binding protein, partial [Planctomycetes bacterium]|nr:ABC transporter ATP-binding protein [Planctomycetota bacterium]